jgi:hypothetical protein
MLLLAIQGLLHANAAAAPGRPAGSRFTNLQL